MKALVVGAGAVGQVLALHLQRAGAEVTFAVRSPHKVVPVVVRRLRALGRVDEALVSAPACAALSGQAFDVAFVTVPSDALLDPWLAQLVPQLGAATVVGLQPGLEDRARLVSLGVDENRLVRGLISLVSFATPLSAHDRVQAPGFAYWLPPLSPFAFDGPDALVSQVVSTLRRGGLPSVRRAGLEREVIFFTAALLVTVRALERHGWSLNALAEDPVLSARASEQALAVTARRLGERVPLVPRLTTLPALLTLAAPLVPLVVPFDFETYARVHFTKVAAQSRLLLGELVREGRAFSLPVDALEQVLSAVGVTPAT